MAGVDVRGVNSNEKDLALTATKRTGSYAASTWRIAELLLDG
jgi:hypothetical protein